MARACAMVAAATTAAQAWWCAAASAQEDEVVVDVVGEVEDAQAPGAWRSTLSAGRLRWRGEELASGVLDLPGTWVRRLGGEGSAATVSVRGASSGQVLVLLDGVALNPARGGGVDLALVPAALIERVDLYRGGSAARFGSGAIGGALNVVPRRPGEGALVWSGGVGAGSFGTLRANAGGAGASGGARWLLGAEGLRSEGGFTFEDTQGTRHERTNADVARFGVLGGVELGEVGFTGLVVGLERGVGGPSEFQGQFAQARQQELGSVVVGRARRAGLGSLGGAPVDGEARLGHRWGRSWYDNPRPALTQAGGYRAEIDEHALDASLSASRWGSSGVWHLTLDGRLAALERRRGDAAAESFWRGSAGLAAVADEGFAGGALRLVPALRLEGVSGAGLAPSPALGVIGRVVEGVEVRGNVARAWRAPSLDELYLDAELVVGDPTLAPEDAVNADLGLRVSGARGFAEVAVFRSDIEGLILFLPVSATRYRAQRAGDVRVVGLEASAELWPWRWLGLSAAYTWTDARFGFPPFDPLPGRPEHKASGEVRARWWGVEVFGQGRYRSPITLDNFGNLVNAEVFTVDGGVVWGPIEGFVLSLTGRNLTGVETAVDALQMPQPGRSVHVQIGFEGGVDRAGVGVGVRR